MDAEQAVSLVTEWILWRGLDYPTDELVAERFETGWTVYAPVDIDDSDPMAFLDMPVGRSVFLAGDSGRIQEVSSSIPPGQAEAEFTAQERLLQPGDGELDGLEGAAEFERQLRTAASEGSTAERSFTAASLPPREGALNLNGDTETAVDASELIDSIAQQLAELGPAGWEQFSAEFALTVTSEVAQLRFTSDEGTGPVPVPQSVADLVRLQREIVARTSEGPWWRLVLTRTDRGATTVTYDYGEVRFPEDQLVAPEHYRNDLENHPRAHVPAWLAEYIAGSATQGSDPFQAVAVEDADNA